MHPNLGFRRSLTANGKRQGGLYCTQTKQAPTRIQASKDVQNHVPDQDQWLLESFLRRACFSVSHTLTSWKVDKRIFDRGAQSGIESAEKISPMRTLFPLLVQSLDQSHQGAVRSPKTNLSAQSPSIMRISERIASRECDHKPAFWSFVHSDSRELLLLPR